MQSTLDINKQDPTWIVVSQPKAFKVILSTRGQKTNPYLKNEADPNKICLAIEKAPLCRIYVKGKYLVDFKFNCLEPNNEDKVGESLQIHGLLGIVNI